MTNVVDLDEYRRRRAWRSLAESILEPPDWPEPVTTSLPQTMHLEGYRPTTEVFDETHLWLSVDDIARRVDAGLKPQTSETRRVWLDSLTASGPPSRLPGIRPGSDDGDAESQPRDPEVPRS